jgi:hypothetical protein
VELVSTHALLGHTEKVNRFQPNIERDVAILEYRADFNRELFAASPAFPDARANGMLGFRLCLETIRFTLYAAMWTDRAFGPALLLKELSGIIFAIELLD